MFPRQQDLSMQKPSKCSRTLRNHYVLSWSPPQRDNTLLFYYTSIQKQTNILQNVLVSVYVCVCVGYSTTEPIGLIFCIQKTKFIRTKHMNIPVLIRILLCFKIEHIIVTSLYNSLNTPKFLVYYRRKTVYLIKI